MTTNDAIAIWVVIVDEELEVVYVRNGYISEDDKHTTGEIFRTYTDAIARAERIAAVLHYDVTAF